MLRVILAIEATAVLHRVTGKIFCARVRISGETLEEDA